MTSASSFVPEGGGDTKIKKGKLPISHRYDRIPLLDSSPGGVLRELVV